MLRSSGARRCAPIPWLAVLLPGLPTAPRARRPPLRTLSPRAALHCPSSPTALPLLSPHPSPRFCRHHGRRLRRHPAQAGLSSVRLDPHPPAAPRSALLPRRRAAGGVCCGGGRPGLPAAADRRHPVGGVGWGACGRVASVPAGGPAGCATGDAGLLQGAAEPRRHRGRCCWFACLPPPNPCMRPSAAAAACRCLPRLAAGAS